MYEKLDYESYRGTTYYGTMGTLQQVYAQQQSYPSAPVYNFQCRGRVLNIKRGEFKLMSKGFDYVTGRVVKELKVKNSTGKEVKSKKIMSRLFRYCMYIGLTYVVLDIAFNFNTIINFIVHTFILHK